MYSITGKRKKKKKIIEKSRETILKIAMQIKYSSIPPYIINFSNIQQTTYIRNDDVPKPATKRTPKNRQLKLHFSQDINISNIFIRVTMIMN